MTEPQVEQGLGQASIEKLSRDNTEMESMDEEMDAPFLAEKQDELVHPNDGSSVPGEDRLHPSDNGMEVEMSLDSVEESDMVESLSEILSVEKSADAHGLGAAGRDRQIEVTSQAKTKGNSTTKEVVKPRKKRTQVSERIPRSKRCGTCPTCLNPHWKKACLTARNEWDKKDIHAHLRKLVDSAGGVSDPSKVKELVGIMNSESSVEARTLLLNVIKMSSKSAQTYFVRKLGVETLQIWLLEEGKLLDEGNQDRAMVLVKILEILEILPVTIAVLNSTQIGRTVRKLKKTASPRVSAMASKVFDKWRSMVSADSTEKVHLKNPIPASAQQAPSLSPVGKDIPQPPETDKSQKLASSKDAPKPAKAEAKQAVLSTADDLLGKKRPLPGPKPRAEKSKKIQVQDILNSIPAVSEPPSNTTSYETKPEVEPNQLAEDTKSKDDGDTPKIMTFGGKPIYIYGQAAGDHPYFKTAADMAKEAAAKVPSPPPSPRRSKTKAKSVKFKDDSHLTEIRWFLKTDEPSVISKGKPTFEPVQVSTGDDKSGAGRVHELMRREAELERQQLQALRAHSMHESGGTTLGHVGEKPGVQWGHSQQPLMQPHQRVLGGDEMREGMQMQQDMGRKRGEMMAGPQQPTGMPSFGDASQRAGFGEMHPSKMQMAGGMPGGMSQGVPQGMYPGRMVNQVPGQMGFGGSQMPVGGQVTGYKYGSLAQGGMRAMAHGGMRQGPMMGPGQGMIPGVGQTNIPGMQQGWIPGMGPLPHQGMRQGAMPGMWQQQQQQQQQQMQQQQLQQQQQQQMPSTVHAANTSAARGGVDQKLLTEVLGNSELMKLLGAVSGGAQAGKQDAGGLASTGSITNVSGTETKTTDPTSENNKTPCAFFNTPKGCRRGNKCKFLHQTS